MRCHSRATTPLKREGEGEGVNRGDVQITQSSVLRPIFFLLQSSWGGRVFSSGWNGSRKSPRQRRRTQQEISSAFSFFFLIFMCFLGGLQSTGRERKGAQRERNADGNNDDDGGCGGCVPAARTRRMGRTRTESCSVPAQHPEYSGSCGIQ